MIAPGVDVCVGVAGENEHRSKHLSLQRFRPVCTPHLSGTAPYPLPYLTVVPLQTLQRYDGEVWERIRRGSPEEREKQERALQSRSLTVRGYPV
jgi:hypothetical protein